MAPATASQSLARASERRIENSRSALRSRTVGQNLVVITYRGSEPELGRRMIEEILEIHREEIIATRNREADAGQEFLSRQLVEQEARLAVALEGLSEFEARFPPPPPGLQRPSGVTSVFTERNILSAFLDRSSA